MSVIQVARMLGRSNETVYRSIRSGRLEATKIGNTFTIPRTAVLRWLRDEQRKANDEWQERIDQVRAS